MSRRTIRISGIALLVLSVVGTRRLAGQSGTDAVNWITYGGDLGNTRYAPIAQIDAANFSKLEVAWRFKTDNLGPRPEFNLEATPLVVNGVFLYSTGGTRRAAFALDAATGELRWVYGLDEGRRGAVAPRQLSGRGLAYWTDGRAARILYVTPGYRLIALDAKDGHPIAGFGSNGVVDLKENMDQAIDPMSGEIGLHATPAVVGDVVIIGAAHRAGGVPSGKTNVKGYVRAFDVRTGRRLWIFHTIPDPGEFGNDTWLNDSWSYTGNAGVWSQISADPQLGLAYLPVELPTGDYYGGQRPGNGLFGETLVAVDVRTGQRKWHFQFVHHGLWDMDIACPPILTDIVVNGRAIKAVAVPTKQAMLYVFDRVTGEPVWPIEERPVPKGDVPGEWYPPTQPFPTRPPPYDRQGLTRDDLIDYTPELHAEALALVSKYRIGPVFTPPVVSKAEGPLATLLLGVGAGGTNWPGGSYDPQTHVLFAPSQRALNPMGLVRPDPSKNDLRYVQGSALSRQDRGAGGRGSSEGGGGEGSGGGAVSVRGLPIFKPPYGSITAINLDRGEILWQIAHGETSDAIRNNPALMGINMPRTGRPGNFGTLVTKTLLVAGESGFGPTPSGQRGAMLRAYDKATGREVGSVFMPAPQTGSPMSYVVGGHQYIVVAVGGAGYSAEFLAFRLPGGAN